MRNIFLCCIVLALGSYRAIAQPGSLDLSFDPGAGVCSNDPWAEIKTVAVQSDGKILIGGHFTHCNLITSNYLARLNANGTVDTSFYTPLAGNGWSVRALAIQPDGKIIAAGDFHTNGLLPPDNIIRLNTNGSIDTSFHIVTGFNNAVFAIGLQPDGKIIAGGLFTSYNDSVCNRLVRINTDGSMDTSFHVSVGADGSVEDLKIQPNGKIVIGGDFSPYDNYLTLRMARVNTDGSVDSSFTALSGPSAVVFAVEPQPNGSVLIGGNFNSYNFEQRPKLARTLDNGGNDPQFYVWDGANTAVEDIKLLSHGNALVVGGFTEFQNRTVNRITIVDSFSRADTTFNKGGTSANETIHSAAIQPDGKIIIGGVFTVYNHTGRNRIARLYNCLTPQPDTIYGNSYALCNGTQQTYSITPITGATKYEWILPQGWTGTSDSTSITATSTGTGGVISVRAFTDSCGYSYPTTRNIDTIKPPGVNICLVTVDTQSMHNIVIWEKPQTELIDSFFVYRETSTNNYSKIASVPYGALSEYIDTDTAADPNATSHRYKLSVLDTCGAESDLSDFHNTIHLQNLGGGNFQWTFYQIENSLNPVLSFNIYRDNLGNGNFSWIGNVPGSNATFTDGTFNSFLNSLYVVDANWSISCSPSRAVNTTRSNIRHHNNIMPTGVQQLNADMLQVYPNPAEKIVTLWLPESIDILKLQLFNTLGQVVLNTTEINNHQLNLEGLSQGVYTLLVETNLGRIMKKILVK